MNKTFEAFRIHQDGRQFRAGIELLHRDDLTEGDVLIEVGYSGINYKDALAGMGRATILRKSPLNGGIDLAGIVVESGAKQFSPGDSVFAQGSGLSEVYDGGYACYARLPAECLLPVPDGLSVFSTMAIGTAGFTAAFCIDLMERNGQSREKGPVLVTGATGGVGSFAVHLLSLLGYESVASTRKQNLRDYLFRIGAAQVIGPLEHVESSLGKQQWGGAIDNLGGTTLAAALKSTRSWGNVVSVGLAQSPSLSISVMPFIIRGVSLLGVTSANCPYETRSRIWQRLANDMKPECIDCIVSGIVGLKDLEDRFDKMLCGETHGRVVVKPSLNQSRTP